MKSVALVLCCLVICAVAQPPKEPQPPQQQQQPQQHAEGPKGFIPLRELKDLKFLPQNMNLRGSVATATDTLFRACVAREPNTAALFITPRTVIIHRSLLPSGGMYRGMIGLLDFAYKCKLSFNSKTFEYNVIAVDEPRGTSIVRIKYSGQFARTGENVETTSTVYMHWRLGKLAKVMLVDDNPKVLMKAYETKAEKVVGKFYSALFACQSGTDCPDAVNFLDENIKHSVSMYPESIAKRLSYDGVAGFKKHVASPDSKWLLDRITNISPIFGDNTTVITCMKLGRGSDAKKAAITSRGMNLNALPGANLDLDSLADLSIISTAKVNEAGKIVSCQQQLSQPIMPWHFRTLGLLGMQSVKEVPKIVANATKPEEKKKN